MGSFPHDIKEKMVIFLNMIRPKTTIEFPLLGHIDS